MESVQCQYQKGVMKCLSGRQWFVFLNIFCGQRRTPLLRASGCI